MNAKETKTYLVGVIERAIAYYRLEAKDARTAAENWADGEFNDRDDEALESEGPCNVRERQPDGSWRKVARSEWDDALPAFTGDRRYSVLLLYPDYAGDYGTETFYALVEAPDPIAAVAVAQREASAAQQGIDIAPDDFAPLLVTEGHHASKPLFNK